MKISMSKNACLANYYHKLSESTVILIAIENNLELSLISSEGDLARIVFDSRESAESFLKTLERFIYRYSPSNARKHRREKRTFEREYYSLAVGHTVLTFDRDTWGGDYFEEALEINLELAESDKPFIGFEIRACLSFSDAESISEKIKTFMN